MKIKQNSLAIEPGNFFLGKQSLLDGFFFSFGGGKQNFKAESHEDYADGCVEDQQKVWGEKAGNSAAEKTHAAKKDQGGKNRAQSKCGYGLFVQLVFCNFGRENAGPEQNGHGVGEGQKQGLDKYALDACGLQGEARQDGNAKGAQKGAEAEENHNGCPKAPKAVLQPGVFSNQGTQTENGQGNIQSVCQADTDHAC